MEFRIQTEAAFFKLQGFQISTKPLKYKPVDSIAQSFYFVGL